MKLSVAMMLGSTTCKMVAGDWNSCALGCAGNAMSIPHEHQQNAWVRADSLLEQWPWLMDRTIGAAPEGFESAECMLYVLITSAFDKNVCEGKMTFEELVDWVSSVEPACGDCNYFECRCQEEATDSVIDSEFVEVCR